MEFDFTSTFYVTEDDLNEMVDLCHRTACSPQDALNYVASRWDDCDYYLVGLVEEKIIAEIKKRLTF